jgi:hypothetical protein
VFINRSKVYDEKFLKLFESIQKYEHLEIANEAREGKKSKLDLVKGSPKKRESLAKISEAAELD